MPHHRYQNLIALLDIGRLLFIIKFLRSTFRVYVANTCRTVGIDRSPEKSPPLASSSTPSKLANTASLRQATIGRYRPALNYQNVKWCTFRLPRWCIFNLPKTIETSVMTRILEAVCKLTVEFVKCFH